MFTGLMGRESSLSSCPEMGGCKWCWQKSQMIVGVHNWGSPNPPCLSEGLFGVGSGPYPPQAARLTHWDCAQPPHRAAKCQGETKPHGDPTSLPQQKLCVFAEGSLKDSHSIQGHKTIVCPQTHFCWKHTAKIAAIESSVNRTISSTLSLKELPKPQKQPKIRLAEWRLAIIIFLLPYQK